jgi:hypothetical protein
MPNSISRASGSRRQPFILLNRLSGKLRRPKSQLIEEALEILEERVFWREVRDAFAGGEPEEMGAERELWDSSATDGLAGNRW